MRPVLAALVVCLGCPLATVEASPAPAPRVVLWGPGASINGVRFWTFRGDARKGQTFALVDSTGVVGTATVLAVVEPYEDKPCFRIAEARTAEEPPATGGGAIAFGPVAGVPAKARAVEVPASFKLDAGRGASAVDLDGDGSADLIFAGPGCGGAPDAYNYCIDSYARKRGKWVVVEHYRDLEGCRRKK